MESINGYIERITFQNEENGFTVARLKEPRKRDLTVVVGAMPSVQPGETLRLQGFWKNSPQFGLQFEVHNYTVEIPSDEEGIKKYLGSGLIKGIGSAFAERIVSYYGCSTLDIIDQDPEKLMQINGIGELRLQKIKQCWQDQKFIREVMLFLQQYHITPTYAQKIFKQYREESIERVKNNPYDLAKDIYGIGFKTADSLAQKMGIDRNSEKRIDAGVEYALSEISNDGHTCFPVDKFLDKATQLLETERTLINDRLGFIARADRIVIDVLLIDNAPVMCVWLKPFHVAEQGIGRELNRIKLDTAKDQPEIFGTEEAQALIKDAENVFQLSLAPQQKEAVEGCISNKISIITGGPGTGKSTITKVILEILKQRCKKILLAAPTGRAAKRLSTVTEREALTLHALLEYDFSIGGFRRNREYPLETDLVIIDEASMIDSLLMYNLLKALPDKAKLVIIGDVDQLPSVGAGNVLYDLLQSGSIAFTRLTEIYRQAAGSAIITNAHKINQGVFPDISIKKDSDFFFIESEVPEDIVTLIADLAEKRLPAKYGFHPVADIQVLCPMRIGVLGVNALNEVLQKKLNPREDGLQKYGRTFQPRDKVMQLRNNYDKGVYNGDIGYIQAIDRIEQEVTVIFDKKAVAYDFSELDELDLAYATSIHKFQGSECPCVIIPVHTAFYRMLHRNLIYTGVTRGKQLVVLVGTKKALYISVKNQDASKRYTGLMQFLKNYKQIEPLSNDIVVIPLF